MLIFDPLGSRITGETKDVEIEPITLPDYHELSNEELLKQTQQLFHDASGTFRAHMRGLKNSALLLEDARTESDNFRLPNMPIVTGDKTSSVEHAKQETERVQARLEAYKQQLVLIRTEQSILEKHIELIKKTQISAGAFEDTIDTIKVALHEIDLRVQDNTLALEKVPEHLQDYTLGTLRNQLESDKETLKSSLESANAEYKVNLARLEEADKVVGAMETLHDSTEERYAQELQRQELLKTYADQAPDTWLAELAQHHDEMVGLQGSLHLSHRQFSQAQTEVEQIVSQLDAQQAPEHQLPHPGVTVGTEEASQVMQQADAIVAYHTDRIKHLQALEQGLDRLLKAGEGLNSEAVVFNDHIFKMQLLAKLADEAVQDGKLQADQVPENVRVAALSAAHAPVAGYVTTSTQAVTKGQARREQIARDIDKSQTASSEVRDQLDHVQKLIALAEHARKWEQELKDLTAEQVASRFEQTRQQIATAAETLNTTRSAFEEAEMQANESREKFDSLTDPLLRLAQQESVAEKATITKTLYTFADLDLPTELKEQAAETTTQLSEQDGGASTQETERYQNLLSTRRRILEEREQQRGELKTTLGAFNKAIEAYLKALHEADQLAQQQYANAVELKKRIGRRQLQGDAIPDGITEALKRDRIEQLEADITAIANEQDGVAQQLDVLSEPDEDSQKLQTSLDTTIAAVGKRLDLLKDLEVLQRNYERSHQDLSEVEKTSLDQAAARRAEAPSDREEMVLSLVPSAAADGLTDVLKVYYQELIDLENKQVNLKEKKVVSERIIELAEAEKTAIDELLPVLRAQVQHLNSDKDAAWVRVQAQLMPKKALELLREYETKTGEHIPPPPAIPEEEREAAIAQASETLFERHTAVVAATKWLTLFEGRLDITGLDGEIGKYQDKVGAIDALGAANQRRIYRLTGHPDETLEKMTPEERPKTEAAQQLFQQGEIGVLRRDRSNQRQQAVIDILIRLAIIVVVAFVLAGIVSLVVNRLINRARAARPTGNEHSLLVLSFFKNLLRSAIWVTAIIMILSTLGFNIGAILAGLGIGGLAVAMAARETLADVIGGVMIFMERPFVIGDTIQVGSGPIAKVVDMNWRTTKLLGTSTYYFNVPNSQVANSTIQNFTRDKPICDWVTLYVSAEHAPEEVVATANRAMHECEGIRHDEGLINTSVVGAAEMGQQTVMVYYPWWYVDDYHRRGLFRGYVWRLLWKHFNEAGIKLEIKPFDLPEDERPPVGLVTQNHPE